MNNKIFYGIIAIIIVAFIGVFYFMSEDKNDPDEISESGYYPYTDKKPEELEGPTIDRLDDDDYHFNKTPEEAKAEIDSGEEVFVYYWSPVCKYCIASTPKLIEAKNKEDFPLVQVNVLEYPEFQQQQNIEVTPTLIYYKDGKEITRAEGGAEDAENYLTWIKNVHEKE